MEQRIQTKLKLTFWVNIFVLIAITIGLMYINGPVWGEGIEPNIIFERYAIVITLVCIPLALKLFHSQIKKNKTSDEEKYLDKYSKFYMLRLSIIDVAALINLAGFYLFESQNLVLMAVICIFATFFCYPGKDLLRLKKEEENENKDEQNETEEKKEKI